MSWYEKLPNCHQKYFLSTFGCHTIAFQKDIKNEVNEENAMQVDEIGNKLCDKQSLILRS